MSRSQQNQVYDQEQKTNQTYNQNAQNAFQQAQQGVTDYKNQLGKFTASNPYTQGGEFQTSMNKQLGDTANAGAKSAAQAIQSAAVRTGSNPAGAIAASEAIADQNERNLATQEGNADAQRIGNEAGYNQTALSATAIPEQMQDTLAQQQAATAQGAAGTEEQAAQTPSFMDMLGNGLIQAGVGFASGAGGAMCPARGSLLLMADGSEKPVELLEEGEQILGFDGEPQRIEGIESDLTPVLLVETDAGHRLRVSRSHSFALPAGGFAEAWAVLGRKIVADKAAKVVAIRRGGLDVVYNVITDGSHTYRANGLWSLGMGESERGLGTQEEVTEHA